MDYLNYSVTVQENLEMKLPFLEAYKKSVCENLQAEEFMIKKVLESSSESRRDYIAESKIPDSHPYKADSKYTQTIMLANQRYSQNKSNDPETFKLIVEKTTECINLKDSIMRDMKKEIEASLGHHERTAKEVNHLITWKADLIDSMAKSDFIVFDQQRVKYAKDSVSQMLERLNSAIGQNSRDIDDIIIKILFNMNTDKVDSLKVETNEVLKVIEIMNKKSFHNKREESLQTLYDFFKRMLKSTHNLRSTYRTSVFSNETDLIDTQTLLNAEPTSETQENPYFSKLEAVKLKIQQLMEVAIEKINSVKAKLNSLKIMYSSIAEGAYSSKEDVDRAYQDIISEMVNLDSTFYGLIVMDVSLFDTLLAKSYQFMNRKLHDAVQSTASGYIEAENSSLYYKLINQGDQDLPLLIDTFLGRFKNHMSESHQENVDKYLLPNFDDETAEITEDEAWRTVVSFNHKKVCKPINLSVDILNVFLEEVNSGRNRNGINYNIFNRDYAHLMLRLSPKLGQMEEFKKFAANAFDPKSWKADKLRIQSISQMVYDLAALENDSTMSNNRKFNTMRDHVNTIKNEVSYFSSIIVSAQRSRPDIQDIVRSYTETLKGLWNRINKEVQSAEQVMIQVLRSAKHDANSQFSSPVELTPDQVKAAHKSQKAVMDELLKYTGKLDENALLYNGENIRRTINSISSNHSALLKDKNINKCFSRALPSLEAEFRYNERMFQDFGTDLLATLQKLLSLYDGLDLNRYKKNLLQYNTVDSQITIRNMIITPLHDDAEFIDSSLFKKTMKGAEKNDRIVDERLTNIAQNYYEYNKTLVDIATQVMKLPAARYEPERKQIFSQIKRLLTSRQDKWYSDVDMILSADLERAFPALPQPPAPQMGGSQMNAGNAGAGGQQGYNAGSQYGAQQGSGAGGQYGSGMNGQAGNQYGAGSTGQYNANAGGQYGAGAGAGGQNGAGTGQNQARAY